VKLSVRVGSTVSLAMIRRLLDSSRRLTIVPVHRPEVCGLAYTRKSVPAPLVLPTGRML
jgi:hypothetical protein